MKRDFSLLQNQSFDLLVCGGGIYGAWTAYDAALRGLKVALVEQGDWAGATSSSSSKLIHGGLRYLESYDFKLVRKALAERDMLLSAAPHRVWPLRFGVPVYAHSRVGTLRLKAGLTLYDGLAGALFGESSHRYFRHSAFVKHFPFLADTQLKAGFTYADAQTDDARLVLELVAGAMAAGAVCVNYSKVADMLEASAEGYKVRIEDRIDNINTEASAKKIVNTTGQWATTLAEGSRWCRLSKGVHLVLPATQIEEALLLTAPADGRVFFIIPWYGLTLLGTTDTDYRGDIHNIAVDEADVVYLLAAANHYLKTAWRREDVINSYAGVRVLKQDQQLATGAPSSMSRDWELKTSVTGVHYSIGGKITSAREDAASIVDTLCAELGLQAACSTRGKPFPWAPQGSYASWHAEFTTRAAHSGIDAESAQWLLRRHGKRSNAIFSMIENDTRLAQRILPSLPFIHADLQLCARDEMVMHLDDLLRRRMPLLILARVNEQQLRSIAASVADILGWDISMQEREIALCKQRWLHP